MFFFRVSPRENAKFSPTDERFSLDLNDTRFQNESMHFPEIYKLQSAVTKKQYIKVAIKSAFGNCTDGGLDYFDVVRNDPVQIMEDAAKSCSKKQGDCKPLPKFCPSSDCISQTVQWEDKQFPNLLQSGCTTIYGSSLFQKEAKCVLKTAVKDQTPPYLIDSSDNTQMESCESWTATKPCGKDIASISTLPDDKIKHHKFHMEQDDCGDGETKLVFYDDKENPGYISYNDQVNSSVTIGDENECLKLRYGICGPKSVSFLSSKDNGLILTNCEGSIEMKQQFDHCG